MLWSERNLKKLGVEKYEKLDKLIDYFIKIKECIKVDLDKNQKKELNQNKDRLDKMKIDDVLKFYVGDEGRRRTFSNEAELSERTLNNDISAAEDEDLGRNKNQFK